jgi:hypothetical protein
MLTLLIVLVALNLMLTFVVFCGQRALWARLPEPVLQNFTVGDVATAEQVRTAMRQAKQPTGPA